MNRLSHYQLLKSNARGHFQSLISLTRLSNSLPDHNLVAGLHMLLVCENEFLDTCYTETIIG